MKTWLVKWQKRIKRWKRFRFFLKLIKTFFKFLIGLANLLIPAYLFYEDVLKDKIKDAKST